MNDNVTTFLANLKHDIRNNQTVEVGSGLFKGQELVDVANALAVVPDLLAALEFIEANTGIVSESVIINTALAAIAKAKGEL